MLENMGWRTLGLMKEQEQREKKKKEPEMACCSF